jgi:hypothetical protein
MAGRGFIVDRKGLDANKMLNAWLRASSLLKPFAHAMRNDHL